MCQGPTSGFWLHLLTGPCLPVPASCVLSPLCHRCLRAPSLARPLHTAGSQPLPLLDLHLLAVRGDIKCYVRIGFLFLFLITSEARLFKNPSPPDLAGSKGCLALMHIRIITRMVGVSHVLISHLCFLGGG